MNSESAHMWFKYILCTIQIQLNASSIDHNSNSCVEKLNDEIYSLNQTAKTDFN